MKTNLHTGKPDKVTKHRPFSHRVEFCNLVLSGVEPYRTMQIVYQDRFCNGGHLAQIMKSTYVKQHLRKGK